MIPDEEEYDDDELSISREKALHERIKRKKAELEYAIFEGKYIHVDDVESAINVIAVETRQALYSIIPRIRNILAAESDYHKVDEILTSEMEDALVKLDELNELKTGTVIEREYDDEEVETPIAETEVLNE